MQVQQQMAVDDQHRDRAAEHLAAAAAQVRRFGLIGEPAARELETLAEIITSRIHRDPAGKEKV